MRGHRGRAAEPVRAPLTSLRTRRPAAHEQVVQRPPPARLSEFNGVRACRGEIVIRVVGVVRGEIVFRVVRVFRGQSVIRAVRGYSTR